MKHKIGIIGFGTVGKGICEILLQKSDYLKDKYNIEYSVVAVVDRRLGTVYNPDGLDIPQLLEHANNKTSFTQNLMNEDTTSLIKKSEATVWFELTDTNLKNGLPALNYIRKALNSGKHVLTTNKGPAFLHYKELQEIATKNNVKFLIEGTVMAGTPVINLLEGPLAGCEISKVSGIFNGTTNYILSEMETGKDYREVLKTAQSLGYAEADPTADVEGFDAMAKVNILSNIIFGKNLVNGDIDRNGITSITKEEILKAKSENKRWKLIGRLEQKNGELSASVKPEKIDLTDPLANVNGNLNAITFTTDLLGDISIIGPGAGKTETGFAILNELIRI